MEDSKEQKVTQEQHRGTYQDVDERIEDPMDPAGDSVETPMLGGNSAKSLLDKYRLADPNTTMGKLKSYGISPAVMIVSVTVLIGLITLLVATIKVSHKSDNEVLWVYNDDAVLSYNSVRREIRNLTSTELSDYFEALNEYKVNGRRDGRGYLEKYDDLVLQHAIATTNTTVDQAHFWAGFLPWHTLLVMELEIALQSINPNVSVPFWDFTIDHDAGEVEESVVFTSDYFGSSLTLKEDFRVDNSLLYNWSIAEVDSDLYGNQYNYLRSPTNRNPSPYLTRYVNSGGDTQLPSSDQYYKCLDDIKSYADFWPCVWGKAGTKYTSAINTYVGQMIGGQWSVDSYEMNHTVQGDFADFITSPNDPLWFSQYAFIDRLYFMWRGEQSNKIFTDADPCGGYYGSAENTEFPQPAGHNLHDVFEPPFYAFRATDEIETLGGLSIAETCYYLRTAVPYTYE